MPPGEPTELELLELEQDEDDVGLTDGGRSLQEMRRMRIEPLLRMLLHYILFILILVSSSFSTKCHSY